MKKPGRRELVDALEIMLKWATGGNKDGNPYCYPAVRHALKVIARERGLTEADYLNFNLRDLPIPA
jgi:hypothetical protein